MQSIINIILFMYLKCREDAQACASCVSHILYLNKVTFTCVYLSLINLGNSQLTELSWWYKMLLNLLLLKLSRHMWAGNDERKLYEICKKAPDWFRHLRARALIGWVADTKQGKTAGGCWRPQFEISTESLRITGSNHRQQLLYSDTNTKPRKRQSNNKQHL